jgi:hypothetical protein
MMRAWRWLMQQVGPGAWYGIDNAFDLQAEGVYEYRRDEWRGHPYRSSPLQGYYVAPAVLDRWR